MKRYQKLLAAAGVCVFLGGCAVDSGEFTALREQVRLQQKQIIDLKGRQEEQQAKLEILDNSFKIVGGKVEDNSQVLDDLESGRAAPSSRSRSSSPSAPMFSPPPAAMPPPVRQTSPPPQAEEIIVSSPLSAADLYRSALDSFTQENYQRSILEFEEFVANHPDHDLADNAQYWIGECYYAQKKFDGAVREFGKVQKHFSSGNKAPAALLKQGLALKELGRDQDAITTLEKVISGYSLSDEASIAEKRLSQWR